MIWNRYSEEVFKYRCLISDYGGLTKLQKHPSYLWEPKSFKQQAAFELAARLEAEQKITELTKELRHLQDLFESFEGRFEMTYHEIVAEILASVECDDWVFTRGQMLGQMHKEEVRRGFEGRQRVVTQILGVEIDERLQEIYSRGFDVGVNGFEPFSVSTDAVLDINDI